MNAIEYIRSLEAVGFTRAQAEVQAQGLSEIMAAGIAFMSLLEHLYK